MQCKDMPFLRQTEIFPDKLFPIYQQSAEEYDGKAVGHCIGKDGNFRKNGRKKSV